jgi:DTW domain-containing protein YfiP
MHPQEAFKQKTGTGRLTNLTLIGSEIIIDTAFDQNLRTQELLNDSSHYPMVLYPGKEAHSTETFNFDSELKNRKLLIFLIDATWRFSRQMISRSPSLQKLPKLSFSREYRSIFEIKKQPTEYSLSTIESSY